MTKPTTENHPAAKPVLWPIAKILPYPKNPRTHPPEQVTLLASLMKRHGVDQPIVVDEDGIILKGHGRRLAAIEAGFEKFPVVRLLGLSENDKRAIRVADNQVSLLSAWDDGLLKMELVELSSAGYDMPLLGFSDMQLVQFEVMPSGAGAHQNGGTPALGNLSERFGVVPFSVLNAREGWWQERKRAWIALGIMSEVGRGENLLKMSDTILEPDPAKRAARKREKANA